MGYTSTANPPLQL